MQSITFDKEKMKRLCQSDPFLAHCFTKHTEELSEEQTLKVLFNTFVLNDTGMEKKYLQS